MLYLLLHLIFAQISRRHSSPFATSLGTNSTMRRLPLRISQSPRLPHRHRLRQRPPSNPAIRQPLHKLRRWIVLKA